MQAPKWINDRYKIIKQLGSGATSTVYSAVDRKDPTEPEVAIKLIGKLTSDDYGSEIREVLFRREVQALSTLNHQAIVRMLDHGIDADTQLFYLVLEYIERARTLYDFLSDWKPSDIECVELMIDLLDAMSYAHQANIIHRDLNPRNILMSQGFAKIIDFGVSKMLGDISAGQTVGDFFTRPYASPEQLSYQEVDVTSDIYSLAAIFYFILTKQHPSLDTPLADQFDLLPELPRSLKDVVSCMAAESPGERYRTAYRALQELRRVRELFTQQSQTAYVVLTRNAIRNLFDQGVLDAQNDSEAVVAVQGFLNAEVFVLPVEGLDYDLLGDAASLRCALTDVKNAFVIKSIRAQITPHELERRRQEGAPVNVQWKVVASNIAVPPNTPRLSNLLDEIDEGFRKKIIEKGQRERRRDLVETWRNILTLDRELRENSLKQVEYRDLELLDRGMLLRVRLLTELDLDALFAQGQALEIETITKRRILVGRYLRQDGEHVLISRFPDIDVNLIPAAGKISVEGRQWAAAWRRQWWALDAIVDQRCINPRMPDVLINPKGAQQNVLDDEIRDFFNPNLDTPKKEAVTAALATKDVFLIQGPPGTGKTVLITEIVAQILRLDPASRILLVSQSNVAIDNVLADVGALIPDLRIVRIGKEENVTVEAEQYLVHRRIGDWAQQTRIRTNEYLATHRLHSDERSELEPFLDLVNELQEIVRNTPPNARKNHQDLRAGIDLLRMRFPSLSIGVSDHSLEAVRIEIERELAVYKSRVELILEDWLRKVGRVSDFDEAYLQACSVIAGTCVGIVGQRSLPDRFNWAIIDEAGRATPSEVLISMVRAERSILVGDHKQLPPVIEHDLRQELNKHENIDPIWIDRSLFEYLFQRLDEQFKTVLRVQYRMHQHIAHLVGNVFYRDEKLETGVREEHRSHGWNRWPRAVIWYSTSNSQQRREQAIGKEGKYYNLHEARIIEQQLLDLEQELRQRNTEIVKEVAVISGYSAQVEQLQRQIDVNDSSRWHHLRIEINTVDAFQGSERDIVFYSVVRSNSHRKIGFLKDFRRLNVALSRAKELLFIVGDHQHVIQADTRGLPNPFSEIVHHLLAYPNECILWSDHDDI